MSFDFCCINNDKVVNETGIGAITQYRRDMRSLACVQRQEASNSGSKHRQLGYFQCPCAPVQMGGGAFEQAASLIELFCGAPVDTLTNCLDIDDVLR
ncbi:MAG: hypothetical protein AAF384_16980 [Pseudomonadota bacterium]